MSVQSKITPLLNFGDITNSSYHNTKVKIRCIVSGITSPPYKVPIEVSVSRKDVAGTSVTHKYRISERGNKLLNFVDVDDAKMDGLLKKILKLRIKKGESVDIKILRTQNIERIFISAPTGGERMQNSSSIAAYYIGKGIEANTKYEMEGYATSDPKSQSATLIFSSATKLKSDAESFVLTDDVYRDLCIFMPTENTVEGIKGQLEAIYNYYAHNITHIVGRHELHMAIDLAFKSPLSFTFNQEKVHKGWADIIIIGDSRTGKTEVAERLAKYFSVGELISGENISHAGLVGGLEMFGKFWNVRWGRIPLGDKELVIIDEAGSLKEEDWSRLSTIRSSGVAEITKIRREVTNARTRVIFLCNPINRTTASYSYGIQALPGIVKAQEDVARFDFAVVVAKAEVSSEEINRPRTPMTEIFPKEFDQALVRWVWSRSMDQVYFSDKAEEYILKQATELGKMYSTQIQLIQGENVRLKLAKLAAQVAARVFSHKNEGEILFVDIQHAIVAYDMLHGFYTKEANGYYYFSQTQLATEKRISENNFSAVDALVNAWGVNKAHVLNYLITNNTITADDISEYLNFPKDACRELISNLLQSSCLFKKGKVYLKTASFTTFLKRKIFGTGEKKI